jgi:hypothetical protein
MDIKINKVMITEEDIKKLEVSVIEVTGVGTTVDIIYDGKPIKRVEI